MKQTKTYWARTGLIIVALLLTGSVVFADDTLWYQGLFDGEVTVPDRPWASYEYSLTAPSAYPFWTERHLLVPRSYRHRAGLWRFSVIYPPQPDPTDEDSDDKDGQQKIHSRRPLPGQYWYERPSPSGFRTPITVGWPYLKYDKW